MGTLLSLQSESNNNNKLANSIQKTLAHISQSLYDQNATYFVDHLTTLKPRERKLIEGVVLIKKDRIEQEREEGNPNAVNDNVENKTTPLQGLDAEATTTANINVPMLNQQRSDEAEDQSMPESANTDPIQSSLVLKADNSQQPLICEEQVQSNKDDESHPNAAYNEVSEYTSYVFVNTNDVEEMQQSEPKSVDGDTNNFKSLTKTTSSSLLEDDKKVLENAADSQGMKTDVADCPLTCGSHVNDNEHADIENVVNSFIHSLVLSIEWHVCVCKCVFKCVFNIET